MTQDSFVIGVIGVIGVTGATLFGCAIANPNLSAELPTVEYRGGAI
jgi:hypothetical protein